MFHGPPVVFTMHKQHLDQFTQFLHSEAELSRVTDRLTDTAIIGNNSLHLVNLMQPINKMPN